MTETPLPPEPPSSARAALAVAVLAVLALVVIELLNASGILGPSWRPVAVTMSVVAAMATIALAGAVSRDRAASRRVLEELSAPATGFVRSVPDEQVVYAGQIIGTILEPHPAESMWQAVTAARPTAL